jgi:hypothetical protein
MNKHDKPKKTNERNDNFSSKQLKNRNDEWEKLQDRYYNNLLNDLKSANIDDEEMLDHLDDFRYPAY